MEPYTIALIVIFAVLIVVAVAVVLSVPSVRERILPYRDRVKTYQMTGTPSTSKGMDSRYIRRSDDE